jgi:hypothetical protein
VFLGLDDSGLDAALCDGITDQKLHENECYQELSSQLDLRRAAQEENVKVYILCRILKSLLHAYNYEISMFVSNIHCLLNVFIILLHVLQPLKSEELVTALLTDYHLADEQIRKQIRQLRIELNHRQSTWVRMYVEPDVRLLSGLLFEWLEHLKSPILSKDDLSHIVVLGSKPENCLKKFDVVSTETRK